MVSRSFFERHRSVRSLACRDYRLLLLGSTLVGMVMPLQFLTQVFWVQDNYPDRDVLYVGLISASRGCAMLAFSLVGGAIADRFERRRVLLWCESNAFALNAVIALLMLTNPFGEGTIFVLTIFTFFAAGNMSIDMPARSASMPTIVGMDHLANAISLNMIALQLAFPVMLPVTGILNSLFEPGPVYAGTLVVWLAVIPLIATLRYRSAGHASRDVSLLGNIRDGLAYSVRDSTIFGVMALVLTLQVVGMPGVANLGPLWMTEVLDLSERGFGFMAMTWGIGAFLASWVFAVRHELPQRGLTICVMTLGFACSAIVFGHSRLIPVTVAANFTLGFCVVGTMVTASTIVQHVVADEMRGRVMGLFPLAMGLAMVGVLPISALAQVTSLELVVPLLSWIMLVLAALIILLRPAIRAVMPAAGSQPLAPALVE
ncbi:MAG: MFS transporter [Hyphomicrobiales bacterium]